VIEIEDIVRFAEYEYPAAQCSIGTRGRCCDG
jgi:hypothetical protein